MLLSVLRAPHPPDMGASDANFLPVLNALPNTTIEDLRLQSASCSPYIASVPYPMHIQYRISSTTVSVGSI